MPKPVIGFICLGLMGGNMVENLQTRGYELNIMDLNADAVAARVNRGAKAMFSAKGAGMSDAPVGRTPAYVKDGLLGPSNLPFMQFCKFYAVDVEEKLGFSIANVNRVLVCFVALEKDPDIESPIAEGTSKCLQAAVDVGLDQNDVPVIFDYFLKLQK